MIRVYTDGRTSGYDANRYLIQDGILCLYKQTSENGSLSDQVAAFAEWKSVEIMKDDEVVSSAQRVINAADHMEVGKWDQSTTAKLTIKKAVEWARKTAFDVALLWLKANSDTLTQLYFSQEIVEYKKETRLESIYGLKVVTDQSIPFGEVHCVSAGWDNPSVGGCRVVFHNVCDRI